MKIAILGAGDFGTALGGILAEKGYDIDYYDPKKEREALKDVLTGAKIIILAMPSELIPFLLPHLPKNVPLIVASKGILSPEVFDEFKDCMILSGPGFAEDLKMHRPIKLTATDKRVVELFSTDYLDFDYTNDKNGVFLCGSLKNAYAILAGYLREEIEIREFVNEAIIEMREILRMNGAKAETVDLVCGREDLRITCAMPSRNFEFGQKIREEGSYCPEKTVEGLSVLKKIKHGEIKVPESAKRLKFLIEISDNWS